MSCPNCGCPRCVRERASDQQQRAAQWNALPRCPTCAGQGKVEDVCGHHVALITCGACRGTGKQGG